MDNNDCKTLPGAGDDFDFGLVFCAGDEDSAACKVKDY